MTNIFNFTYNDSMSEIQAFIDAKKSDIIETYPFVSLFNATEKEDAIVTRATSYNVFSFSDECQNLNTLLSFIKQSFANLQSSINVGYEFQYKVRPAIIGWILEDDPNDSLDTLSHGGNESWSVVSGRFIVFGNNGYTSYVNGTNSINVDNVPGTLTLFNSNTIATASKNQDSPMVSIDFNIYWYKDGIGDISILQNILDM